MNIAYFIFSFTFIGLLSLAHFRDKIVEFYLKRFSSKETELTDTLKCLDYIYITSAILFALMIISVISGAVIR